ncbi:DUF4124 domain-containing protein [Oligoflexia bacterium]|nr:DUF4124 domain-containing protein [Oligoflexia bacterium]
MLNRKPLLRICFLVACLAFVTATAQARPVYKWEDSEGTVHFSSKAPGPNAKPAELPEISRGEVKLTKRALVSCGSHGGINCQAGADQDGSVICYDGFKGASARYRFSCNSPKLEIAEISDTREGTFSVFVRNSKSVDASKPAVLFKLETGRRVKLSGPEEIEAFGLAEFKYESDGNNLLIGKVSLAQLDLTCANCP